MAERFTEKQGQYLAFIYNYSVIFGQSPAEADLQRFFGTSAPTVHQMLKTLTAKQFISRVPGKARSIALLVDLDEIPRLVRPSGGR
ncbi:SOS response transcriptional repressor [Thiorhodococcus mannitoliphagus]|uniref:SOS response transcriptional repressor n=1 Tax=Thiorhodococcus mannitoliphagus TaxID=329406 RepID=A0A6P1DZF2_9GAMM|nr:SOS response transcriptional repressor [Thiorhodococcus mannitoliphagus]NEX23069.1 SOS response transcriptional repressor [Thiorhodococcus mannitoliphagus]